LPSDEIEKRIGQGFVRNSSANVTQIPQEVRLVLKSVPQAKPIDPKGIGLVGYLHRRLETFRDEESTPSRFLPAILECRDDQFQLFTIQAIRSHQLAFVAAAYQLLTDRLADQA
jgi:hypothetical protein